MATLIPMVLPMAMVMGRHSPCELWDLDAIHHGNGIAIFHLMMLTLMVVPKPLS